MDKITMARKRREEDNPSQLLPGEIDVKFIDVADKDENGSAQYTGKYAKNWYTPPGFTFGEEELSGIWVGKFETGYSSGEGTGVGAASVTAAQSDTEEPNKAIIKPNVYSWRMIRVSTLDLVSRRMTESGNVFGFDQSTYDSHAMKNTEWALISYLTQSKYGKYGNFLYNGANKEVYMNNNSNFVTGCSSGLPSASAVAVCTNQYSVMNSQGSGKGYAGAGASTTGNISGIYDINGGGMEYMMGVLTYNNQKYSGNTKSLNSGFEGLLGDGNIFTENARPWPEDKYYNAYITSSPLIACNGPCKGHALNETGGWYGDVANTVLYTYPWFVRGGNYNNVNTAGIFSYADTYGFAYNVCAFRQVLVPLA